MDDFDALAAQSEQGGDEEPNVEQPKGGKGKGKGRGGGKASGKGRAKNDNCFVCPEKKLRNSKFCKDHNRAYENMKYQAQRAKEMQAFTQIMGDPGKAKVAIDDFLRENPEGSCRKRLVDWASFKREHGVRESDEAFKELLKGPYDREGEGPLTKLWLPKLKERMRDRSHYSDASMVEGSKQIKDVDRKEREDLMQVCQSSVGGHDSSFIRSAGTQQALAIEAAPVKEEEAEEEKPDKKAKKVANVADERPKKYGKLKKDRGDLFLHILFHCREHIFPLLDYAFR
eukprot:s3755_g7.t1